MDISNTNIIYKPGEIAEYWDYMHHEHPDYKNEGDMYYYHDVEIISCMDFGVGSYLIRHTTGMMADTEEILLSKDLRKKK